MGYIRIDLIQDGMVVQEQDEDEEEDVSTDQNFYCSSNTERKTKTQKKQTNKGNRKH
jgi:hypothetical protein